MLKRIAACLAVYENELTQITLEDFEGLLGFLASFDGDDVSNLKRFVDGALSIWTLEKKVTISSDICMISSYIMKWILCIYLGIKNFAGIQQMMRRFRNSQLKINCPFVSHKIVFIHPWD